MQIPRFLFNNTRNININYSHFKFNYSHNTCIYYNKDIDSYLYPKSAYKL